MFLVDTNVVSQMRKPRPVPEVASWWRKHIMSEMFLSAVTLHELRFGIELAPSGAKRDGLEQWLVEYLIPAFAGRILPVDLSVADMCGRLAAKSKARGSSPELADALIAATAKVHGLRVATLNRKHFDRLGVELVTF